MALLRPLARLPLNTTVLEVPLPATCVLPSLPSHAGFHGQLGTGDHSSLKFPTSVSLGFKPCLVRLSYGHDFSSAAAPTPSGPAPPPTARLALGRA